METNRILTADLLDIVFDGRNKSYGAYDLRKTYHERVKRALGITLFICLLLFVGSILANTFKGKEKPLDKAIDITLVNVPPVEKMIEEPLPQPKFQKPEEVKVAIDKYVAITVVPDPEVKPQDEVKSIDELDNVKIGKIHQDGVLDDGTYNAPVGPETHGTGNNVTLAAKEDDLTGIVSIVQIEAEFPGGKAAWTKYLERNLNSSLPTDEGAPAGKYSVLLSFVVDREGNISDIQAETNPGYGTVNEAIRILKKSPKWKPAVQNGRNVGYRVRQQVTFQVNEG